MGEKISIFQIHHLLRNYTEKVKYDDVKIESKNTCLNTFRADQILSPHGKKTELMDQIVTEAIVHFTTCVWEKGAQKIAGDILVDLSGENGSRKPYGTLIQDSRRR
jgi:hypothetical protein